MRLYSAGIWSSVWIICALICVPATLPAEEFLPDEADLYDRLQLPVNASAERVQALSAYFIENAEYYSADEQKRIIEALKVLGNTESRDQYDQNDTLPRFEDSEKLRKKSIFEILNTSPDKSRESLLDAFSDRWRKAKPHSLKRRKLEVALLSFFFPERRTRFHKLSRIEKSNIYTAAKDFKNRKEKYEPNGELRSDATESGNESEKWKHLSPSLQYKLRELRSIADKRGLLEKQRELLAENWDEAEAKILQNAMAKKRLRLSLMDDGAQNKLEERFLDTFKAIVTTTSPEELTKKIRLANRMEAEMGLPSVQTRWLGHLAGYRFGDLAKKAKTPEQRKELMETLFKINYWPAGTQIRDVYTELAKGFQKSSVGPDQHKFKVIGNYYHSATFGVEPRRLREFIEASVYSSVNQFADELGRLNRQATFSRQAQASLYDYLATPPEKIGDLKRKISGFEREIGVLRQRQDDIRRPLIRNHLKGLAKFSLAALGAGFFVGFGGPTAAIAAAAIVKSANIRDLYTVPGDMTALGKTKRQIRDIQNRRNALRHLVEACQKN